MFEVGICKIASWETCFSNQKWKRSERATHIMWLRWQAKATIRKQTIALWTVWVYSRLTVGKTITFAKVPTLLIVNTISKIMAVGSIPTRRIMWNSTRILCGGMTVTGGVVAKLVGWSTHLFVSGRGFESFRYDGAELMWYCMCCAVAYREYGARCPHICPHSSMVEQSL